MVVVLLGEAGRVVCVVLRAVSVCVAEGVLWGGEDEEGGSGGSGGGVWGDGEGAGGGVREGGREGGREGRKEGGKESKKDVYINVDSKTQDKANLPSKVTIRNKNNKQIPHIFICLAKCVRDFRFLSAISYCYHHLPYILQVLRRLPLSLPFLLPLLHRPALLPLLHSILTPPIPIPSPREDRPSLTNIIIYLLSYFEVLF